MGYEFRESKDSFYIISNVLFNNFMSTTCLKCNEIGYHCKEIQKQSSGFMKYCICKKCLDLKTTKVSFEVVMKHNIRHFMKEENSQNFLRPFPIFPKRF